MTIYSIIEERQKKLGFSVTKNQKATTTTNTMYTIIVVVIIITTVGLKAAEATKTANSIPGKLIMMENQLLVMGSSQEDY